MPTVWRRCANVQSQHPCAINKYSKVARKKLRRGITWTRCKKVEKPEWVYVEKKRDRMTHKIEEVHKETTSTNACVVQKRTDIFYRNAAV